MGEEQRRALEELHRRIDERVAAIARKHAGWPCRALPIFEWLRLVDFVWSTVSHVRPGDPARHIEVSGGDTVHSAAMRSLLAVLCVLALAAPGLASAGERFNPNKRVNLVVQRADVQSVLRLLCDQARLNLVMGDDVKGTVTLQLRDAPWQEVLATVLRSQSLGSEQRGNILRVAPLKQLQEEAETRAKIARARELDGPMVTRIIPVNYANAKDLAPLVQQQLSERGSVTVDARTNSLIVRDVEPSR